MSSIRPNSGSTSPIVVSPSKGAKDGVLPKGKLNDPMPLVKDAPLPNDPPHFTPGPNGELPGKPGSAKPPTFVPDSGVHNDLNDLFDDGAVVVAPPGGKGPQGRLPDGPLGDPMPKVKGNPPPNVVVPYAPGPEGLSPGALAPIELDKGGPALGVAIRDTCGEGKGLPPQATIFPKPVTPPFSFAEVKAELLDRLKRDLSGLKITIASCNARIANPKNREDAKLAKAQLAFYSLQDKCFKEIQSLAKNFKIPPSTDFTENKQAAYAADIFIKMAKYVSNNMGELNKDNLFPDQIKKDLDGFKKALANLPPPEDGKSPKTIKLH